MRDVMNLTKRIGSEDFNFIRAPRPIAAQLRCQVEACFKPRRMPGLGLGSERIPVARPPSPRRKADIAAQMVREIRQPDRRRAGLFAPERGADQRRDDRKQAVALDHVVHKRAKAPRGTEIDCTHAGSAARLRGTALV